MTLLDLPPGLSWRPPRRDDLPAVLALISLSEERLLGEAFRSSRERGAPRGELSTDSRTGALTLYEKLGMRVRWAFTQWAGEPVVR